MKKILCFCLGAVILAGPLAVQAQNVQEDELLLAIYFDMDQYLDQKIEVATRAPKSFRQIAENVTVVSAEEIQRMNAHNVAEVLNRVAGVFVSFNGQDYNSSASFTIHDSDYTHVLILLDGLRWNEVYGGFPMTNAIPIEIIDRIEVIKGPGSSTWGSSLGGVVNIITKKTGTTIKPKTTLYASYGEANSQQYSASASGKAGPAGYFLSVGSQNSDGHMANRFYDRENIYGKMKIELPHASSLSFTAGYSEPEFRLFDSNLYSWRAETQERYFWTTAALDSSLSDTIFIHANVFRKEQKKINTHYTLPDEVFLSEVYQNNTTIGFQGTVTLQSENHTVVTGGEIDRSDAELQTATDHDENWGLFFNDTWQHENVAITPGIRYDHHSKTDHFTSPSLGLTWQIFDHTLLRALYAKGFRRPYIGEATPGLDPERVTTYQLGFETTVLTAILIKTTLFEHTLQDTWIWDWGASMNRNGGKAKHYGYEIELKTQPWHHLSLQSSFTYVYTDYYGENIWGAIDNDDLYSGKVTFLYDHPAFLTAELFGTYTWWNEFNASSSSSSYDTMIWDLNVSKTLEINEKMSVDLFATAHNIFDGRHYWHFLYENPHRWIEAGLRFHF